MFEKILELLAALAVALSGAAGLSTAAENVGRGVPTESSALVSLTEEHAAIAATRGLARAAEANDEANAEANTAAAEAALDALAQAMENTPDAADPGLTLAMEAVSAGGAGSAGDASDVAPVSVPAVPAPPVTGASTMTPPVDTPAGPPADVGAP